MSSKVSSLASWKEGCWHPTSLMVQASSSACRVTSFNWPSGSVHHRNGTNMRILPVPHERQWECTSQSSGRCRPSRMCLTALSCPKPLATRRPDRLPMCRVDGHANVRASMFVIFLVGCQVCFPTQSHFANCFAELLLASKEPHAMWSHFANCFFESLSLTVTQCSGHLIRSLGTARPSHGIRCSATTTMAGHKAQTVSPYMRVTWGMVEP